MKGRTAVTIMFSLIGVSILLAIIAIKSEPPDAWKNRDNTITAYFMMQEFVKKNLKSPSTAQFPDYKEITINKNNFVYSVSGYVDAQNSFGAIMRTYYSGKIEQVSKDNWRGVDLNFKE